jgi:hypothetical protein
MGGTEKHIKKGKKSLKYYFSTIQLIGHMKKPDGFPSGF